MLRMAGQKKRRWISCQVPFLRRPMVAVLLPWMCHRHPNAEQSWWRAAEQRVWWLLAQPAFCTTWKIITCVSSVLRSAGEQDLACTHQLWGLVILFTHPHRVGTAHNRQAVRILQDPIARLWWFLFLCVWFSAPLFSHHSLTCWPNSASWDGATELPKLLRIYKFCDTVWLGRSFIEFSLVWE